MPNCSHPTAHPRQRREAVWSSVPQGKKRITAQMGTTINKYIRKRYKGKLLAANENSLLCETCFAKEQRRMFGNKSSTVSSSDEELSQSIPSASLLSESLSKKTLQISSKPFNAPNEASSSLLLNYSFGAPSSLFVHSTPIVSAKEPALDFVQNISSTDVSSPSDVESKCDVKSKTDKNKLNALLDVFNLFQEI